MHLTIFEWLKSLFFYISMILSLGTLAQDKLYLMDGTCKTVKVLEIGPDYIIVVPLSESGAPFRDANESIYKGDVVLIEYKSGLIEIYTLPKKTALYNSEGVLKKDPKKDTREFSFNFASINTLAICNADIRDFLKDL